MKLAWVAGVAAAAVVAVALVDAVRRDGETAPSARTAELENRDELVAALTRLGVRGELRLHDGACGATLLTLPELERRESGLACAPAGVHSPDGSLVARCVDGRIEVTSSETGELDWFDRGCVPAWRPDGALTAVYAGQIVQLRPCAAFPCIAIPLSELERAARLHPAIPDRSARVRALVDGVAWVSPTRAAVALSPRLPGADFGPIGMIAFFENGRVLQTLQEQFRSTGEALAASPRGTYVTQSAGLILRRDGSLVTVPPDLRDARALAWSPDERFLALATRFAVVVVPVASLERYDRTGGGLRSVTLPQTAAGLSWC